MKQEIQLFIGGEEVEFSKDPQILFNYKITDATNPTAIKNTYSKSIVLEGTQKNNAIFGNIWNLERMQYYGYDGGPGFNPIKKTPFELYVNGELVESGYVKLDNVSKKNGNTSYSLTLYGGLGSLFFSLSYNDGEGDKKKTLADLRYGWDRSWNDVDQPLDLSFKINKETVFDAWQVILENPDAVYDEADADRPNNYLYDEKWRTINFMPAYEGIPEDFSPEKVLINTNDNTFFETDVDGYKPVNGFLLGEMSEDLTMNQTKDLRSYLQRPVIRMKSIIDACCDPVNNGGWELKLDDRFFNWENPYYNDTWLTLGTIRENLEGGEKETLTTATLTKEGSDYYRIYTNTDTLSEYTNIRLNFGLKFTPSTSTTKSNLYLNYKYDGDTRGISGERTKYYHFESAFLVQLIAYDSTGTAVAQSDTQYLYSGAASGFGPIYDYFKGKWENDGVPTGSINYRDGRFTKIGNAYFWSESKVSGEGTAINFKLPSNVPFRYLKLKVMNPYRIHYKQKQGLNSSESSYGGNNQGQLWTNPYVHYKGNKTLSEAINAGAKISGTFDVGVSDVNMISQDYESLFSDTQVNVYDVLSTKYTPAEYLTGYAKMFGLYFWRDPAERSSDPEKFPKGVIHLMDRSTFYNEDEIIDLSNYIDRSQEIKITPQIPTKKWLRFEVEQAESEAAEEYSKTYGEVYGSKRVDTNFNFNIETEDLIDKIPYRGGIDALEVDKYFNRWVADEVPSYVFNGFKYSLFKVNGTELETTEVEVPVERDTYFPINKNGWENTDSFAKLQLHSAENEPIDGENILVFLTGNSYYEEDRNTYWLTDDIQEMVTLNEGEPCYILTHTEDTVSTYNLNGQIGPQKIAYAFAFLPKFQRNIVGYSGIITHSLSMGEPRTTYVRDTYVHKDMGIYGKCWRKFMTDLYDVNNRKLTCSVRFPERPNGMMLRRFYWFDNSIWRLNTVTDWNISSYAPTKCEFVKVMEIDNYRNDVITNVASYNMQFVNITLVKEEENLSGIIERYYTMTSDAQDIVLRVQSQGERWCLNTEQEPDLYFKYEDGTVGSLDMYEVMSPSNNCNSGDGERIFSIPENVKNSARTFEFVIEDSNDRYHRCYVTQQAGNYVGPTILPYFELDPSIIAAPQSGGFYTIDLKQNTTDRYEVGPLPQWITLTGKEDNYFEIRVLTNTGEFSRRATITVTAFTLGAADVTKTLTVNQGYRKPINPELPEKTDEE